MVIGKTDDSNLNELIVQYTKRLAHYVNFSIEILPDIKQTKNLSESQQKTKEAAQILNKIAPGDLLILLDEKGKQYSSVGFADQLQKRMNSGVKQLIFVIGGPYGFSDEVYQKSQGKISLSTMTFSHQMIRLLFIEQLYRGFTILRNEPYHHR